MEFQNRLIVITGGAGGIARQTAKILLAQGAELLLIDPSASLLEAGAAELADARVRTVVSALESPEACRAALARLERPVYALVHLAGIFRPDALDGAHRPLWDATMAANLTNAFDMAAAVRPQLDLEATCRMVFASCSRSAAARSITSRTARPRAASSAWSVRSRDRSRPRCWSMVWPRASS